MAIKMKDLSAFEYEEALKYVASSRKIERTLKWRFL